MQFRTEINLPPATHLFSHKASFFTLGSCFADVMGSRLKEMKANSLVNPFGTIFNPISANKLLRAALFGNSSFLDKGLVEHQGIWHHYDFHSSFSATQPQDLVQELTLVLQKAKTFLQQAQILLLTWGTAFVYERNDTGALVANCHKLPQKQFQKRLLSNQEILEDTQQTLELLYQHNPQLRVILTISPVRHLKDTLPLNSVSKSLLRVAAYQLEEQDSLLSYFPAYELLLDDLRDYRFYGNDLIHPSTMAEEYIWQKFISTYADESFHQFLHQWQEIQRDLAHRAFQPQSEAHQKFLRKLLIKLQQISSLVDVQEEMATVQRQLRT